jgi:ADP-ribosyl-[dinitrogen reductase] hydrolase
MNSALKTAIVGTILGTAVGDAMGLPYEGLSRDRQKLLYPEITGQRLIFNCGMMSDDTEHTCLVAQALILSTGNVTTFQRELAGRLQFWLLGLPAGIGFATLRSIVKLWLGFSPDRSGVFSAGNGSAMRSPLLGVCFGHQPERLRELVSVSTRITHSDPKAEYGAMAVAIAAYLASQNIEVAPDDFYQQLEQALGNEAAEFLGLMQAAIASAKAGESSCEFADTIGRPGGVSGYVYHTVPVVLQTWLRYQTDYKSAIVEIIRCGGDADTTAAILGAIIGARVGKNGIPWEWLGQMVDYPRSVKWLEKLGDRLYRSLDGELNKAMPLAIPLLLIRNLAFLVIVLGHGFRRLLPLYREKKPAADLPSP